MQLDIEKVLKSKKPELSPLIAKPLCAYLRRIAHQNDLNQILINFKGDNSAINFVRHTLSEINITHQAHGLDNIDTSKRYIFASNHPFGGLDGLMLADHVERKFGDARIIVNDLLMNIAPLAPLFVPVNKHGKQNSDYAKMYKEALHSQMPLITFPAGVCSRRIDGKVQDLRWKTSFVKHAIESDRDIVPVYFDGRLSNFFYGLHNLREKLHIKANVEMLYLVDEMFKQRGQHFDIYFGEPISIGELKSQFTPKIWCDRLRLNTYNLKK